MKLLRTLLALLAVCYVGSVLLVVWQVHGLVYQRPGSASYLSGCGVAPADGNPLSNGSSCDGPAITTPSFTLNYDVIHWRYPEYLGIGPVNSANVYVPLDVLAALLVIIVMLRYRGARPLSRTLALRWLVGGLAGWYAAYGLVAMVGYHNWLYPIRGARQYQGCGPDPNTDLNPLSAGASCRAVTVTAPFHYYITASEWQNAVQEPTTSTDTLVYLPLDEAAALWLLAAALRPGLIPRLRKLRQPKN